MANALSVPEIVIGIVTVQETLCAFSEEVVKMYQVVYGDQIVLVSKLKMMTFVSND